MDFLSIEEIERARAVLADPCPQPILEAGRVMLANAKDKTTAERRRREDVLTAASSAASPGESPLLLSSLVFSNYPDNL